MRNYLKVDENPEDKFNFWRVRHNKAVDNPEGFEVPIINIIEALERYRWLHLRNYSSDITQDGFLFPHGIQPIVEGVRGLLNGEIGRLDAGTIDGYLCKVLKDGGVAV